MESAVTPCPCQSGSTSHPSSASGLPRVERQRHLRSGRQSGPHACCEAFMRERSAESTIPILLRKPHRWLRTVNLKGF
jgi:hypothetical protein